MALQTPIVATDAGGTSDILRADVDGLIVPCGDAAVLARAIERTLLEATPTAARVVNARERVETTLSFDRRMAAVERIYMELAERIRRPLQGPVAEECA
jgi:glycosyltransferase involved in cell wall biosynthesis